MGTQRTIITISDDDKSWLESYSKTTGVPMAEIVRTAIKRLRQQESESVYHALLQQTRGIWKKGEGLAYQERLRSEWR